MPCLKLVLSPEGVRNQEFVYNNSTADWFYRRNIWMVREKRRKANREWFWAPNYNLEDKWRHKILYGEYSVFGIINVQLSGVKWGVDFIIEVLLLYS